MKIENKCKSCKHEKVCRFKDAFEGSKELLEISSNWLESDNFSIELKCKHYEEVWRNNYGTITATPYYNGFKIGDNISISDSINICHSNTVPTATLTSSGDNNGQSTKI